MNKLQVIKEFKSILSLVKTLSNEYCKKQVNVYFVQSDNPKIDRNKLKQQLDFLSEFGMITTIIETGNKFEIGLSLDVLVFYQNYYDDINYILNTDFDNLDPQSGPHNILFTGTMSRITKMFKSFDTRQHCNKCCTDALLNEEIEE